MIRSVAARYGVSESLLFTWRRQAREGLLGGAVSQSPVFVPVRMVGATSTAVAPSMRGHVRPRPRPRDLQMRLA